MEVLAVLVAGHVVLAVSTFLFLTNPPFVRTRTWVLPDARFLRSAAPFIVMFVAILLVHVTVVALDGFFAAGLPDFTQMMYEWEGDLPAAFQAIRHPILDLFLVGVYVFTYPFLIYATPALLVLHRDRTNLAMLVAAFLVGYALAVPFFMWLNIYDPWHASDQAWYAGQAVDFRLRTVWPEVLPGYYTFTSPNNELPSFHSQLSAMIAGVAWLSGYRRFAIFATACAILIPISSLYVGVHWLTDIAVGQVFAAISVAAGWWARKTFFEARSESAVVAAAAPEPLRVEA